MASRRIKITEDIIENAMVANSSHCMIAEAIREQVPDATYISVDLQTIRFSRGEERFVYFTPRSAQLALIAFDQGEGDIEPFSFALGSPTQVVKRKPVPATDAKGVERREAGRRGGKIGGKRAQEKARLARAAAAKKGTTKVGGRLPPTFTVQSNLGNRRVFGLRAARA